MMMMTMIFVLMVIGNYNCYYYSVIVLIVCIENSMSVDIRDF